MSKFTVFLTDRAMNLRKIVRVAATSEDQAKLKAMTQHPEYTAAAASRG